MRNVVQLLQIISCSCVNEATLFSLLSLLRENGRSLHFPTIFLKNKLSDGMIKRLLNSVIAKYRDLLVSRRSIICLRLRFRKIIDLLASDKSWYFTQPYPIIANSAPFHGYLQVLNYNIPYNRAPHLTGKEQVSLTITIVFLQY